MRTPRTLLPLLCLAAGCLLLGRLAAPGQPPAKQPPPEAVFGGGAGKEWTAPAADYHLDKETVLGKPVLTVDKGGLVLDSNSILTGPRQLRAWVRLRTDLA